MSDLVSQALAKWSPVALYLERVGNRNRWPYGAAWSLDSCDHWRRTPARRAGRPGDHAKNGTCRWCRTKDLPPGRRTWCSDRCVDAFLSTKGHAHLVKRVQDRDGQCCRICRFDGGLERERARRIANIVEAHAADRRSSDRPPLSFRPLSGWAGYTRHFEMALGMRLGYSAASRAWFDIDHTVPKSLGGRNELPNLRLLCVRCHRDETAKLRVVLAAIRRYGFCFATDLDERAARRRGRAK